MKSKSRLSCGAHRNLSKIYNFGIYVERPDVGLTNVQKMASKMADYLFIFRLQYAPDNKKKCIMWVR